MKVLPPSGPERRQQFRRLGVLILGLTAVVWYQWRPAAPAAPASNSPVRAPAPIDAMKLPDSVKLGELDAVSEAAAVGRNPFGFGTRPAPPPPPVVFTPTTPPPPPAPPPGRQGPPPITLKLMAMMVIPNTGRRMVTLKDPGTGALFQAFEGDVVDGRYRLVKVGVQSVVMSYVDGSGARTIALGG